MRGRLPATLLTAVLALPLAACGGQTTADPTPSPEASAGDSPATSPTATPTPSGSSSPEPSGSPQPRVTERADPRWRFFSEDRIRHSSPWFAGRHRVMIGYGCTVAPYYERDPRCPGRQGFHHGIDVAIPCGTPLFAAVRGVVLDPSSSGTPGAAYGERAFRIRTSSVDVLVGHSRRVFVQPGDRVRPRQRIALVSDSAAPDGCHLHFEVRRHGGGVSDALDPAPLLQLSP